MRIGLCHRPISCGYWRATIARQPGLKINRQRPKQWDTQFFCLCSNAAVAEDLSWRRDAAEKIAPGLASYSAALSDTIGLRQQPKLPREQALYVASCSSGHRDISLHF